MSDKKAKIMKTDDLLFSGGPILTMAESMEAEAVLLSGGYIRRVGSLSDCRDIAGQFCEEIDLAGRCLMPGFVDPHAHMLMFAQYSTMADLGQPHIKTIDDLLDALKAHAKNLPADAAIRGFGYNQNNLVEGRHPTAIELDRVASNRPVYILQTSGHSGAANSYLLKQAGVRPNTPDPEGGELERDEQGRPNGVMKDNALKFVVGEGVDIGNHGPNFHIPENLEEFVSMLDAASKRYLAAGITTSVDVQVTRREMEAYVAARDQGVLGNRVVMMYLSSYLDDLIHLGLKGTLGDAFLSFGPLKLYADGSTTSGTAYFSAPYLTDPDNYGFLFHTPEELTKLIVKAHNYGLQTATHAIGDAAIECVIDAIAAAQGSLERRDMRHRIEHCYFPSEEHCVRMQSLGIWPVVQPRFIYELGDSLVTLLGEDRARFMKPLGRFKQYGLPLVLSSDSPVADYRPLPAIASALNRATAQGNILGAEFRISIEDALKAYTINAAAAVHREKDLGSIEAGKWADLVVLDRNPLQTPQQEIENIQVLETWVAGRRVFSE
jgi:predicted amidohydrolase YtcJ